MKNSALTSHLLKMNKGIHSFADLAAGKIAVSDWAAARSIYKWLHLQVEVISDIVRNIEQKEGPSGCNCKPRYINEATQKEGSEPKTCETCKHCRRFDKQAMHVCEKHLIVDPMYGCGYYKKRGGEE